MSALTTNRQSDFRVHHVIMCNRIKYCSVVLFSYNGEFVSTMGGCVRYMFNLTSICSKSVLCVIGENIESIPYH